MNTAAWPAVKVLSKYEEDICGYPVVLVLSNGYTLYMEVKEYIFDRLFEGSTYSLWVDGDTMTVWGYKNVDG